MMVASVLGFLRLNISCLLWLVCLLIVADLLAFSRNSRVLLSSVPFALSVFGLLAGMGSQA